MAKRMQEGKGEERIVARSKPTLNLASQAATSSSTVQSPYRVEKSEDTQGTLSTRWEEYRETCSERTQSRHSVEFSSVAKRCNGGREYEETLSGRAEPGTPEFPWKSEEYDETRRFRKLRHQQYWQNLATQPPNICCPLTASWDGFLECETKIWSQFGRQNGKSRCERGFMGNLYVRHSSSCSSSWKRLFREFTFRQENQSMRSLKTVVPSNWDTDHGSDRNYRYSCDRLAAATVAKDNLAYWQGSSFATANIYVFSDSVLCLGGVSPDLIRAWKDKINWFMDSRSIQRIGSNRRWAGGVRVEKFPWISATSGIFAEIQKDDDWNKNVNLSTTKEGSSSCQCFTTLNEENWETERVALRNLSLRSMFEKIAPGHRSCLGPGSESRWYGTLRFPTQWRMGRSCWDHDDQCQWKWTSRFSRIQCFWERGDLKSKGKGWSTVHFNGSDETIEVILRAVIPSISSASTEQWTSVETQLGRYPETRRVRWNLERLSSWKLL